MGISRKKGFSFGEVLLAVLVLGVSLVGTIELISKNIRNSIDSRNVVVAASLAQEGTELVRNIRDRNWAASPKRDSFNTGTSSGFPGSGGSTSCRIDRDDVVINCSTSNFILNLDSNGFYSHNSGTTTKFRRRITISYSGSGVNQKAIVTSFVSWGGSSDPPSSTGECNISSKCAYSIITLSKWGEE